MKYLGVNIAIPYFDSGGMKQWYSINIHDTEIDRRRVLRGVRKFVQENFNKRVNNRWVQLNCIIRGVKYMPRPSIPVVMRQIMESAGNIKMDKLALEVMEQYEDDIKANPSLAEEDTPEAKRSLCSVFNQAAG